MVVFEEYYSRGIRGQGIEEGVDCVSGIEPYSVMLCMQFVT